jgi:sialate O-acetylesterase
MTRTGFFRFFTTALMLTFGFTTETGAEEWRQALDLSGVWKFEIGDDSSYAGPACDDSQWERIEVPGAWENEGYPGYDGFAWYRVRFSLPEKAKDHVLHVYLGRIDDVDEVYLNGRLIGYQGHMPPAFETAYHVTRRYLLPPSFLKDRDNLLAVRVYDDMLAGGIVDGDVGIYYQLDEIRVPFSLAGEWKLNMGDDPRWSASDFDDTDWRKVAAPVFWDCFGNKNYDGVGWYRKKFVVPQDLHSEKLILFLGKIDDVDEVYLNGKKLGRTGPWPDHVRSYDYYGEHYNEYRAYFIPANMLKLEGENVLAVRVFDGLVHGGIWDGPLGLVTQRDYRSWLRRNSSQADFFKWLWEK